MREKIFIKKFGLNNNKDNNKYFKDDILINKLIIVDINDNFDDIIKSYSIGNLALIKKECDEMMYIINSSEVKFQKNYKLFFI